MRFILLIPILLFSVIVYATDSQDPNLISIRFGTLISDLTIEIQYKSTSGSVRQESIELTKGKTVLKNYSILADPVRELKVIRIFDKKNNIDTTDIVCEPTFKENNRFTTDENNTNKGNSTIHSQNIELPKDVEIKVYGNKKNKPLYTRPVKQKPNSTNIVKPKNKDEYQIVIVRDGSFGVTRYGCIVTH